MNDSLTGSDTANEIIGGDGADKIYGYAENDTLTGGGGNDTIDGGAGNDTIDGGDGFDEFYYDAPDDGNDVINNFVRLDDSFQFNFDNFDGSAGFYTINGTYSGIERGDAETPLFVVDNVNGKLWYDNNGNTCLLYTSPSPRDRS